ncbi:hypothetical protein HYALB_00009553 [Hymenoscyphus albidus]|uniref:Utp8 beta-propeller domain-containing protein n=1 Tax=Hymenoscyphus albidus TaxID=595503 RepID=A0A9N9LJJ7_9HELO|nr:hypothetical protein HYALB_00009553 [Hymenoscyphus albidus]
MPSKFSLQNPYVVASLPRPIDINNGRYVVGEVFGGAVGAGAKKRKRSELAIGIDGEGINLYDISSSKLITSYALPPLSSFTCAPSSVRIRISKTRAERRTYASTSWTQAQVTLFRDVTEGPSSTTSATTSHVIQKTENPIVFMSTTAATMGPEALAGALDLLVVKKDGEIHCLDGETLQEKWISPAAALVTQDAGQAIEAEIEYAHMTNAFAVSQGVFKGRQDIFAMFNEEISQDAFNPDMLVLISKTTANPSSRRIHIVTLPRRSSVHVNGLQHSVHPLLFAAFPFTSSAPSQGATTFSIQVSTGTLMQLHNNTLTTFDLTETGLKEQSSLSTNTAKSFLRLSNTSILLSSEDNLSVISPKYQSILATVDTGLSGDRESLKRKRDSEHESKSIPAGSHALKAYFPKLGAAIAIVDSNLVGIQIEGQYDRKGRARAAGLLIDSIGCAIPGHQRHRISDSNIAKLDSETLSAYQAASMTAKTSDATWTSRMQILEKSFNAGDIDKFDELMISTLSAKVKKTRDSLSTTEDQNFDDALKRKAHATDRRWILYALSKLFSCVELDSGKRQLAVSFYTPKSFMWLITAGFMTVTNIQAALKIANAQSSISSGELVNAICEINPDMEFLLALIRNNHLDAAELVCALRLLMESLEIGGGNDHTKQLLLTNGDETDLADGAIEDQLEQLEQEAERDLDFAEYQLGPGAGIRGQAISAAFTKLYACPTNSIVQALQSHLSTQDTVAVMYLLRMQLSEGSWTSKHLDFDPSEVNDEYPSSENAIILISSLLCNCIDAVGAGGWLSGDTRLVRSDPFDAQDLVSGLKLEVSAALEAIEEATYLKGIISEMVRYGQAVQNALPKEPKGEKGTPANKKHKPITLESADPDQRLLPLGLKAEQLVSRVRVGGGGEINVRSSRDIGNRKSQKVGKYSLEKIVI